MFGGSVLFFWAVVVCSLAEGSLQSDSARWPHAPPPPPPPIYIPPVIQANSVPGPSQEVASPTRSEEIGNGGVSTPTRSSTLNGAGNVGLGNNGGFANPFAGFNPGSNGINLGGLTSGGPLANAFSPRSGPFSGQNGPGLISNARSPAGAFPSFPFASMPFGATLLPSGSSQNLGQNAYFYGNQNRGFTDYVIQNFPIGASISTIGIYRNNGNAPTLVTPLFPNVASGTPNPSAGVPSSSGILPNPSSSTPSPTSSPNFFRGTLGNGGYFMGTGAPLPSDSNLFLNPQLYSVVLNTTSGVFSGPVSLDVSSLPSVVPSMFNLFTSWLGRQQPQPPPPQPTVSVPAMSTTRRSEADPPSSQGSLSESGSVFSNDIGGSLGQQVAGAPISGANPFASSSSSLGMGSGTVSSSGVSVPRTEGVVQPNDRIYNRQPSPPPSPSPMQQILDLFVALSNYIRSSSPPSSSSGSSSQSGSSSVSGSSFFSGSSASPNSDPLGTILNILTSYASNNQGSSNSGSSSTVSSLSNALGNYYGTGSSYTDMASTLLGLMNGGNVPGSNASGGNTGMMNQLFGLMSALGNNGGGN